MPWSATWNFTTRSTPPTLSSPANNAIDRNPNVTLYWNSITGVSYYDYEIDTTPNFNSSLLIAGYRTGSSFTTSNLLFGQTYYWRVRARSSSDTTAWSSTWNFTVLTGPITLSSPSNGAVNQNINVTLYWNTVSGIDYYDYQLDTTPNFNSPLLLSSYRTGSSLSTSNLLFGKTYYWRIKARHAADTMPWSATWNFTTRITAPTLSSPADNAIDRNPNVTLYWNSMNGVSYYDYEIDTTPNFNSPLLIAGYRTGNSFTTSNLLFGQTYYWRVRARSSSDITAWSSTWNFTVLTGPITLSSPSNGAVNQNINVTLYWNTVGGIDYYDYQLDTTPNFNSPLLLSSYRTGSSLSTSNLLFGKTYYWRIKARHAADTMPWSATWNFTTRLTAPTLSSPADNAIDRNPNVTLYWNSMNGVSYYDYEIDTTPNFNSPLLIAGYRTGSSFTTSNLLFGQTYYWRVRARSSSDITAWSSTWNFTVLTGPITLSSPSNGAVNQNINVTLYWNTVGGIDYYDYQLDTTPNFNSPLLLSSYRTGSSLSTSNLLFGKTYYWRIKARHAADTMPWSATWNFTTRLTAPTLSSPADNAIDRNPNVTLYWNSMNGVSYYDYEIDTTPNFNSPLLISGYRTGNSFTTSNLLFGQTYYWRVRARSSSDITAWSSTWNFTVLTGPITLSSPSNGAVNQNINVTLYWNTVGGIDYYDYQLDTTPNFNSPLLLSSYRTGSSLSTSNLLFGKTYYWRIRARHAADTMPWSDTWNFSTLNRMTLSSPANGASNVATNPTLYWNSLSGVNYYDYQCDITPNFNSSLLISGSRSSSYTSYMLNNLTFGTVYYWRVRARHTADTTRWSDTWNFSTTYQLTTPPTLISPANQSQNIPCHIGTTLSWSSAAGATYYEIIYADNANFNNAISDTTTALSILTDSLLCTTTYYWKVRGGDNFGYSPWSDIWSFTTDSLAVINPLAAPTLIAPADQSVNISWTGTTLQWNFVQFATQYEYQLADNQNFLNATTGQTAILTYFTDTLQQNSTYYWKVRALNSTDISPWSDIWSFTTDSLAVINPLAAPTLIAPANQSVNISWTGTTLQWNFVQFATQYEYQLADNQNFLNATTGQTAILTYFTDTLQQNSTYYWKVRALNSTDISPWSDIWSFTTDSLAVINPLAAPTLVAPANQSVNISWTGTTLAWNLVQFATQYEYQLADNQNFSNATTGQTAILTYFTDTLQQNSTYYWKVRALNSTDISPWSDIWSFTTDSLAVINPLAAPTLVAPADQSVNISWTGTTLTWNFVQFATQYEYQLANNQNFLNATTGQTAILTYFTDTLQQNSTYYWKVRALNSTDISPWSDTWSFTTDSLATINPLAAPTLVAPANQSVNISWTGTTLAWNLVQFATQYEYQLADNQNFSNATTGQTAILTYFTDTLQQSSTYYWKVRALNSTDISPWSDTWSFTTETITKISENRQNSYQIYPNPANNYVVLKVLNEESQLSIKIVDSQGKLIYSIANIKEEETIINTTLWSNGLYFMMIRKNNETTSHSIIINH
jgi:hypothetical protein